MEKSDGGDAFRRETEMGWEMDTVGTPPQRKANCTPDDPPGLTCARNS